MRKTITLLLVFLIFLALPIMSEAVVIGGETVIVPYKKVYVSYAIDEYEEALIWSYTAPDNYKITSGNFNVLLRDASTGSSERFTRFRIYLDGVAIYTGSTTKPEYTNTITPSFNSRSANNITLTVFRVGPEGSEYSAEVNSGSITIGADVADNTIVIEAKNAANAAKSSADTAATRANTAASNASSANTNANEAKKMLNGSSNGGKSLAATYDKANASSQDTTYIRNLQLSTLTSHTSLLKPPPNKIIKLAAVPA